MSHDYHEKLPGFHPQQILVDGCRECEARSRRNDHGISSMDRELFVAAWSRAREWQKYGLPTISDAEVPLLFLYDLEACCELLGCLRRAA